MYNLFIDDERFPTFINEDNNDFIIKRTFEDVEEYVNINGCPSFISFDHDLGMKNDNQLHKSGFDIAKWLVEKDIESNGTFFPEDFSYQVHSMNPIGKENIQGYLNSYFKFKKNN